MLHVFAEGYSDKGRLLRGEFLDYRILIETVGEDPNLDVKPKDHYFGRVVKVNDNHTEATIIPIKAVNGGRAEKNKGRIYHSERKSIV
jgi:hypothetical protein